MNIFAGYFPGNKCPPQQLGLPGYRVYPGLCHRHSHSYFPDQVFQAPPASLLFDGNLLYRQHLDGIVAQLYQPAFVQNPVCHYGRGDYFPDPGYRQFRSALGKKSLASVLDFCRLLDCFHHRPTHRDLHFNHFFLACQFLDDLSSDACNLRPFTDLRAPGHPAEPVQQGQ